MKFRRDSDIESCGVSIILDAGGGVREVACMRVEGHKGDHISMMGDAARADGVCHGCREPTPEHRHDCFVLGTVPDELVDELQDSFDHADVWNCLREAVLKGTTLTKPTPAVNEGMLKELEQAFANYEFDSSVCGDRKVIKLTAAEATGIAMDILKK